MTFDFRKDTCGGYTMIETIMVLLVVGILTATMLIRADSVVKRGVPDQANILIRDLRHIQSIALTSGIALRLNVTATGYFVCLATALRCASVADAMTDPATSQRFAVTLPSALTIIAVNSLDVATAWVDFDSIGRPSAGSALIATDPVLTFRLTGASSTLSVKLHPITGFSEVSP